MYVLGVKVHNSSRIEAVDNRLQEIVPSGIESMVIELPENWNEVSEYANSSLFEEIAKRYSERGTQVFYGDSALIVPVYIRRDIDSLRREGLSKSEILLKQLSLLAYSFIDFTSQGVIDGFFKHNRDKHFEKIVKSAQPEVVVVGDLHARYLAKVFPEANYIRV